MLPSYYINGDEPQLVGALCSGFVLLHVHEGRQIINEVNVAYLRLGEQWYSLCFECTTIFWRASDGPEPPTNDDFAFGLLFNDLSEMEGVVGHTIREVNYEGPESGDVEVRLRFSSGQQLIFKYDCEADATRLVVEPWSDLDKG